jgi:hypothetical protein
MYNFQTLDQLIAKLNLRFNREIIMIIKSMVHLLKLEINNVYNFLLSYVFDLDTANSETENRLLNQPKINQVTNC